MIKAEILADSINLCGDRITTFKLVMPRIVLAEFNTHRMFSRNSASSRAIPFEKMLRSVLDNPFIPIKWMKDHKGMQGNEYFTEDGHELRDKEEGFLNDVHYLKCRWASAKHNAVAEALRLSEAGVTKQFCNRLLEPFMWHTVICTATEFENFFALRAHEAAELHIQDLAYKMLDVYNTSTPKKLNIGEWHIPFGDQMDEEALKKLMNESGLPDLDGKQLERLKLRVATARCARVSYTVVGEEGKPDDYKKDVDLHDRLLMSGHLSPFEHCAQVRHPDMVEWSGNFKGWTQYRKTLTGENQSDERVIKLM